MPIHKSTVIDGQDLAASKVTLGVGLSSGYTPESSASGLSMAQGGANEVSVAIPTNTYAMHILIAGSSGQMEAFIAGGTAGGTIYAKSAALGYVPVSLTSSYQSIGAAAFSGQYIQIKIVSGTLYYKVTSTSGLGSTVYINTLFLEYSETGDEAHSNVTFNEPATDNAAGTQAIFDSATVGESVAFPNLLYLKSDGKWWKTDANAAATMPGLRMALESKSADQTCSMLVSGRVQDNDWNWTVGGLIYASASATGGLVQTAPSGSTDIVQVVGVAYHADKMIFCPSIDTIEIA